MSALFEQIERARTTEDGSLDGLYSGAIAETAAATTDLLPVTLDIVAGGAQLQIGKCRWMPRLKTVTVNVAEGAESAHNIDVAQIVMPTRGDKCLVGFDDAGVGWIVVWWPA